MTKFLTEKWLKFFEKNVSYSLHFQKPNSKISFDLVHFEIIYDFFVWTKMVALREI